MFIETGISPSKGSHPNFSDSGSSVRISSYAQYNTGLFILDLNRAPWGCGKSASNDRRQYNGLKAFSGVWPAFWTLGNGNWPYVRPFSSYRAHLREPIQYILQTGEIDIIEGVHDNQHNQVTWHTKPGTCPTVSPRLHSTHFPPRLHFESANELYGDHCGMWLLILYVPF